MNRNKNKMKELSVLIKNKRRELPLNSKNHTDTILQLIQIRSMIITSLSFKMLSTHLTRII